MKDLSQNTALLPSGFEDLLPPNAETEYAAIAELMSVFRSFGYERVKPPLAEFEESILAPGPGAFLAADTFRLMDPVTHRMMGLRADITAQIARIALSRLSEEPRPLRVTYANDVIRTRRSQARTQRQFTQVGCELIGADALEADVEICVVVLKALSALGLKDVTLDFALPRITDDIFKVTKSAASEIDALRHQLAGPAEKAFAALDKIKLPKDAKAHVKRLRSIIEEVQVALEGLGLSDVKLTIDPLETRGFEYHNGFAFTAFAGGIRGEIGRGGRYEIFDGDVPKESAAGFTLYMDTLREGLSGFVKGDVKTVPADTSWAEIQSLQEQGFIVKREIK
ncbi:MAG: ATP phosphoribosyltransferase regulatory subunit [Pseudomonadota bacterium]